MPACFPSGVSYVFRHPPSAGGSRILGPFDFAQLREVKLRTFANVAACVRRNGAERGARGALSNWNCKLWQLRNRAAISRGCRAAVRYGAEFFGHPSPCRGSGGRSFLLRSQRGTDQARLRLTEAGRRTGTNDLNEPRLTLRLRRAAECCNKCLLYAFSQLGSVA